MRKVGWLLVFYFFCALSYGAVQDTTILRIEKLADLKFKTQEYDLAAQFAWESGEYQRALKYCDLGLKISRAQNYMDLTASLLNNKGIALDYIGDYTASLKCFFEALPIQEKRKETPAQADILSNIGLVYMRQNLWEKSLEYHNKALLLNRKNKDLHGISASLNNMAIIYGWQKKFKEAIANYKECIKIDLQIADERGLGDDYNNIAICYTDLGQYQEARNYLEKALTIRKKQDNRLGICETYNNFAAIFQNQGIWKKAEDYYRLSLPLAKELGAKESLKYIYENLHKVAANQQKMKDAYEYHKLYILYRDSLDDIDNVRIQTEQELNYKNDKEKERLKLLQEQKAEREKERAQLIQESREERFFIILSVSAGVTLLLLIFALILFRRWRHSQSQQRLIEQNNLLVEQKNRDILDSINYAKRIQTAILPADEFIKENLPKSFVLYLPKDIVAGDFYWLERKANKLFFAVADCTGHGVPGALMSVVCHNALNRALNEFNCYQSDALLNKTRAIIVNDLSKNSSSVYDGMDISLCVIDVLEKSLEWSGANNPLWIYRHDSSQLDTIKPDKQSIGRQGINKAFTPHKIQLEPYDRIFLFTDGFADQFGGEENKKLMIKRFKDWILQSSSLSINEQKSFLENKFLEWKGQQEQVDDVCVVGFTI